MKLLLFRHGSCGMLSIHSFNKCLLSVYYVPSTVLEDGDKAMDKTR